jgi:hypothetical protein
MTGLVHTDVTVARIYGLSAGITNSGLKHAGYFAEAGLYAPKTAGAKSSFFGHRNSSII